MAVKNHALDSRITEAARAEFLEKGYRGASLQSIAGRAGTTTGALYTRYQGKDDLFRSLVREVLEAVRGRQEELARQYDRAGEADSPEAVLSVIRTEEQVYLDLLTHHREACVLLFCRSDGSSVEEGLRQAMTRKAEGTADYLRTLGLREVNSDAVVLLMAGQFRAFRELLDRDFDEDRLLRCLRTMERYMEAGWQALLESGR